VSWRDREDWARPIPVPHGIRARSQRGDIGETWWSRRFLDALSARIDPGRLARGKNYARIGQVIALEVLPGVVSAIVQGSRRSPYAVTLDVRVLDDAQWQAVETQMAARAVFLARLLSGEMPEQIEEAFAAAGTQLFAIHGIRATCSCPDAAPTCKHVAAVFLLLAEAFDRDPFLMLAWRGRSRDALIRELRERRPPPAPARRAIAATNPAPAEHPEAGFWDADLDPAELRVQRAVTTSPDAILREADPATVLALGREIVDGLEAMYRTFVPAARHRLDPSRSAGAAAGAPRPRRRTATGDSRTRS